MKEDIPCAFFIILSIVFLINYLRDANARTLLVSAAFGGVAAATKAYGLMMIPVLMMAILVQNLDAKHGFSKNVGRKVLLTAGAVAVFWLAFFVCSPYNFIDPLGRESTFGPFYKVIRKASAAFGIEVAPDPGDFIGERLGVYEGFFDYLGVLTDSSGMGWFIAGVGILGLLFMTFRLNRTMVVFVSFPVLFFFVSVFTNPGYAESRHQVPLYPFLAIAGGFLITNLAGLKGMRPWAVYGVMGLLLCHPAYKIIERNIQVSREDTRNLAKAWIETTIPAGTRLLLDENGPQLVMTEKQLEALLKEARKADPKGQFTAHFPRYLEYQLTAARDSITYDLKEIRFPWWRQSDYEGGFRYLDSEYDRDMANPLIRVGVESYDFYVSDGFKYAVVISNRYNTFLRDTPSAKRFPAFRDFYRDLFEKGVLVKEFTPEDGNATGPTVKIFKLAGSQ